MAGLAVILLLLAVTLRSASRVWRVCAPLFAAVLVVTAALALLGIPLTLLHLVGLLLVVAVGSNYSLFFDQRHQSSAQHEVLDNSTLVSLLFANITTMIGFGLLAFSQVPVLKAIGITVGPGAFLALMFSAVLSHRDAS
jgi:predicted exporter